MKMPRRRLKRIVLTLYGIFWILFGLAVNPFSLAHLLSPDGTIESPLFVGVILVFEVVLIAWGSAVILFWQRPVIAKLSLAVASLVFLGPLISEVVFRAGIAINAPKFRTPSWYADSFTDDNFWKLTYLWSENKRIIGVGRVHPRLGWSQTDVTSANPLGLQTDTRERLSRDGKPKILFYGDSFVKGSSDAEYQIPKYLDERIADWDVLDLGVDGYGTDQVYMMFQETHREVDDPVIIFGILTTDIDRMLLTFRAMPKPRFEIDADGDLIEVGTPITDTKAEFTRKHPPRLFYALNFLCGRLVSWGPTREDRQKTKELAAKVIEELVTTTRERQVRLVVVLFYPKWGLQITDWREEFLKQAFRNHDIEIVDTKVELLRDASGDVTIDSVYADDGHHNNLGNQMIAEGILRVLSR